MVKYIALLEDIQNAILSCYRHDTPGTFLDLFSGTSRVGHAIRDAIAAKRLPQELEAVLLVSLMEAADRVDSTTGLQMA